MKSSKLIYASAMLLVMLSLASLPMQLGARSAQPRGSQLIAGAEQVTGDRFSVITSTPRGVTVIAVNAPRADVLATIDRGLAELFAVARRHGYQNHLSFSDYTVFIARADRNKDSSGQYSPDIAVPAGQYAGGYYDQGGFIYAAGMVLAFNPSAFILAEHERDLSRISNIVRYEGEHIILYYNDRALYARTADHSRGGGHPILQ
ncbi:MAG TPA: hypothetical protein VLN44_12595 [Pyrinomonadaceae bacterium]|nr:hypothetical protein [Pyrinomonadaceae bacterium]